MKDGIRAGPAALVEESRNTYKMGVWSFEEERGYVKLEGQRAGQY
jgi:hypothetical protein